jgi:hypothetical protein
MDFIRSYYTKSKAIYSDNPAMLAAIEISKFAFEKWSYINDYTPVYAAAVLLYPSLREAYINKY